MVRDDKRGHRSWWWMLAGAAGLAFIMMAILLWSSGPGNPGAPVAQAALDTATPTVTPTATATVNPHCQLTVTKSDSPDPVAEDGEITYTITVTNDADTGQCDDLTITDVIPDDTDCVDTSIGSSDIDLRDATGCDDSGTVKWRDDSDHLSAGDSAEVTMVVDLTSGASDGDRIDNEACATSTGDLNGDCDTERTKVGAGATSTPVPTATSIATVMPTPRPAAAPLVAPVAPAPSAGLAPTLVSPLTGTGAESASGGSQPLALALGLAGGCLLLGGVALLKRPR